MVVTPFTTAGTASVILAVSKEAWKLGSSLSKLDQDAKIIDTTVRNLAVEVKSLSNECDLIYTILKEVASKCETGSPPPFGVDGRIWNCLAIQAEETSHTLQELELFIKSVRGEESGFIGQAQRQRKLDKSKDQITSIKTKVCRHTDNLRISLLLINTCKELDQLQGMVEQLQRSAEANPHSRHSHTEATLMQCARGVMVKGTTMYEASLAAESVVRGQGAANSSIRVAEWVSTLESIRRDQQRSNPSDIVSNVPSICPGEEAHTVATSAASAQGTVQECEVADAVGDDPDDDLYIDLAKGALCTGTKAFEAHEWAEADDQLQDALRILQQLPKQQRAFCDIFCLQYKLAVCTYHMQKPTDAEEALMSLVQQPASSDEQRGYIYDAAHLLSRLYIRMGKIDRARSECEKALKARRRLLGKQSDASLESTALMVHIYGLLGNRARANSYCAMIPESRRDFFLKSIEESLGTKVDHLDCSSLLTGSTSEESDLAVKRNSNRLSASSLPLPTENRWSNPISTVISQSPVASLRQVHQHTPSNEVDLEDLRSTRVTSLSSIDERSGSRTTENKRANENYSADTEESSATYPRAGKSPDTNETLKCKTLSRKEILEKIGCQPRDPIESAVCDGDHSALATLLNKRKDFWRSKVRKRVGRPERVTALHFAALFGEIDMAQHLLSSSFNINEVPFGYSASILTPLKFAIGARQVDMVGFLISNGARPTEPDTWSTLAGQLMNRSWLMKTMSETEKEYVPSKIIAILKILLRYGWDVNTPFETSGRTVLHQAVAFWTGSYRWDLRLRAAITSFLCEEGANPFQSNIKGETPYGLASASGDQDLLQVLDQILRQRELDSRLAEPYELSS
ncbi:hypothetical protein BGZ60DRAFT_469873 [Tricladium varicosporioides]|nr:hypothetical protein BGZ60DRAFT_469873 [Hymenoscyphus varicosporioides]